jgi:hypothetical protein
MKQQTISHHSLLSWSAVFAILLTAHGAKAQTLQADRLRIGSNNTFGNLMMGQAIGFQNSINANYQLVLGRNNSASNWGQYAMTIGGWNTNSASSSIIVGDGNNGLLNPGLGSARMSSSAIFGNYNQSVGNGSIIVGNNNQILAQNHTTEEGDSYQTGPPMALIGQGLISRDANCLIVGKNNVVTSQNNTPTAPLFIIANGTSAATQDRSNAFEVRANGDIIIAKPQGDISMGAYGGE